MNDPTTPTAEAARRRTFAIISHPDAGKTTLTEKFLLYAGAIQEAGAVKAQAGRRRATSDWMAMEQQRGISISSTVLQFDYCDHVVNLLDTPGHRDFSEDTYRVLAAADAAIMVLDSARGVEPQTLKLFEVCRARRLPVLTFLNKMDRPGLEPLALIDEIEQKIGLRPTPVTWPVGDPGSFRGVIDRRRGDFVRFTRTDRGATAAGEEIVSGEAARAELGPVWERAADECALLDEIGAVVDVKSFLAGESTPVFVGSAITNFGVRHLLDAVIDLAPSPAPVLDVDEAPRALDSPCSGFVFKVQANMNPAHRDHVAFVRICSGHFERGMTLVHQPSSKPFATKYASSVFGAERMTVEDAWPGDVVGLVNASGLRIGDSLYLDAPVVYPRIPAFPPELIASAHSTDVSRHKQFRRGVEQLEREGVVQVLHRSAGPAGSWDPHPVLAAVGQMQFEVFAHRMAQEFSAPVTMGTYSQRTVRLTDAATAEHLRGYSVVEVLQRGDGALLAMFESPYFLARMESDHPDWVLAPILTT